MLLLVADVAALVMAVEADMAKVARFLSEFEEERAGLLERADRRDSSSRSGSSSAEIDDIVVASEAVSEVTVVLSEPMIGRQI